MGGCESESARGDLHAAPRMWDMRFAGVWFSMGGCESDSARGDLHAAPRMWDMRFAGVWFSMGGCARLTPMCLRPIGDARCAPHTPHWDQIARPGFRFVEGQIGGLGAE